MSEKPILFNRPMVRAIVDRSKTQTRRVATPNHKVCPYGGPGDELWVRETWGYLRQFFDIDAPARGPVIFGADGNPDGCHGDAWNPSIHMPRWASRIQLEITSVRREQLQAITASDARAEGAASRHHFQDIWNDVNGKRAPWSSNPSVWAVAFRVLRVLPAPLHVEGPANDP